MFTSPTGRKLTLSPETRFSRKEGPHSLRRLLPDFPGLLCAHSTTFSPAQSLTESILKFALCRPTMVGLFCCCRRHVLAHGKLHDERAVGECLNYFFVYSRTAGASNFMKRKHSVAAFHFQILVSSFHQQKNGF